VFYGLFRHAVDAKGRVALPAQFRRDLTGAVIAPGPENRLVIRPSAEWQRFEDALNATPQSSPEQRLYRRHVLAEAHAVDVDSQGRILLTADHRAFAQIADRAVFVGVSNVVEVVGESVWDAESAALDPQTLTELGDRVSFPGVVAAAEQA
jgi:MraZ protein